MGTTSWCGLKRKAIDQEVLLLQLEEGSDVLETVVPLDGCRVRVETCSLNPIRWSDAENHRRVSEV